MSKIILSRKGFDSAAGKCASPILDGKTLLSLPIPIKDENSERHIRYSELSYNGINYADLISNLKPNFPDKFCHLDPDIRHGIKTKKGRKPAFGQAGIAQRVLTSSGISVGDIFLFLAGLEGLRKKTASIAILPKKQEPTLPVMQT